MAQQGQLDTLSAKGKAEEERLRELAGEVGRLKAEEEARGATFDRDRQEPGSLFFTFLETGSLFFSPYTLHPKSYTLNP